MHFFDGGQQTKPNSFFDVSAEHVHTCHDLACDPCVSVYMLVYGRVDAWNSSHVLVLLLISIAEGRTEQSSTATVNPLRKAQCTLHHY